MKQLRTFAAQSEARKRIIKAGVGGTALFCLSLALSQNAHADDATSVATELAVQPQAPVLATPSIDPTSSSSTPSVMLDSVAAAVDGATVTVQNAVETATATLQAIPDVQAKVAELPVAQAAVDSATAAVQTALTAIATAHESLVTAQSSAELVVVAQAGVDSATAVVADKTAIVVEAQSVVDTATATVLTAQTTLSTLQNAQPALDAAAACTEGSACVHFYNTNAELGPLHDQIAVAQQANSDAYWDGVNWVHTVMEPDRATYEAAVVTSDAAHADAVAAIPVVAAATDAANTTQDAATQAQAAADASTVTTTTDGVKATVYAGTGRTPALPTANTTPILTTTVPQIAFNWGSGSVMGGPSDRVIVKFEGTITVPQEAVAVKYAVSSDDGSMMYINGQLAINNWRDQGTTWSPYSPVYSTTNTKQQDFVIWYYENGGGATCTLGWMIFRADGTGYFTTPGASAFGTTIITNDPALVSAAISAKAASIQAAADLANAQANLDAANAADARAWADRGAAYQKLVEDYTHLSEIEAARPALAQAITDAQTAYDDKLAERNAAWDAYTSAVHAASDNAAAIPVAQAAYDQAMQNLTTAQENLTTVLENLTTAQKNLTTQQTVLDLAQATAASNLTAANDLATTAVQTANSAANVLSTSTATIQNAIAEKAAADAAAAKAAADAAAAKAAADKAAADKAAADAQAAAEKAAADAVAAKAAAEKAAADAKAAEEAKAKAEADAAAAKAAADKAAADKAAADAAAKAQADADAKAAADKAAADAAAAKAEADAKAQAAADAKAAADKAAAEKSAADAKAAAAQAAADKATADKAAADKAAADKAAAAATGVIPNNPDQLSDTVVKQAPAEVLVPHVQVDTPGVENGGIQFFGTKSAPQVVGEDGKLTPAAPPPGSGLPIPADAITTADTFIGQPGGTTFNAPDIAVPVIETPVTGAIAAVPGVQALNHAFVAMANIGNDMSPVTRKKAKKILVLTTVIAAVRRRFN